MDTDYIQNAAVASSVDLVTCLHLQCFHTGICFHNAPYIKTPIQTIHC